MTPQEIEALKSERDALAAQVEAMRIGTEYIKNKLYILVATGVYVKRDADKAFAKCDKILKATPQQCLRDVEAKAGRAGFMAGASKWVAAVHPIYAEDAIPDIEADADQYAAKVRQGGAE